MITYYKAEIHCFTELFVNNDKDQGCDPLTWRDCGVIETITKSTLEELKQHLTGEPNSYSYEYVEDNRYDGGYEETERDGTHVSVSLSAYIYKMTEEEVSL